MTSKTLYDTGPMRVESYAARYRTRARLTRTGTLAIDYDSLYDGEGYPHTAYYAFGNYPPLPDWSCEESINHFFWRLASYQPDRERRFSWYSRQ